MSEPALTIATSRGFTDWLAEVNASLAFTSARAGKLFLVGSSAEGRLSIYERTYPGAGAVWSDGRTIWMSSLFQVWRFEDALGEGRTSADGYDRVFVPRVAYTTGDVGIADVVREGSGRVVFANGALGCLATVSDTHSFVPLWRPPFAAEGLNGVALSEGRARYVTLSGGGLVMDAAANEVAASGLSLPQSPRMRDGRLWLLQAGRGELGYLDGGRFVEACGWPAALCGLAFVGDYAVVGMTTSRAAATGPIAEALGDAEERCGLVVVDLRSGATVHWLRLEGVVREVSGVAVLPGARRPAVLGLKGDEARRVLSVGAEGLL